MGAVSACREEVGGRPRSWPHDLQWANPPARRCTITKKSPIYVCPIVCAVTALSCFKWPFPLGNPLSIDSREETFSISSCSAGGALGVLSMFLRECRPRVKDCVLAAIASRCPFSCANAGRASGTASSLPLHPAQRLSWRRPLWPPLRPAQRLS